MESTSTQTEIQILQAELEFERKMRRETEFVNQILVVELDKERRAKEEADERAKMLESEVTYNNAEMEKLLHEIEEERKMIRIAELWREERVQIKLSEAKLLMEKKLKEIGDFICLQEAMKRAEEVGPTCQNNRKKEAENPHIKRGIKGFVEFPKTTRVQIKDERDDLESNLECQRAQLRVLLRNKGSNCFTQQNLVL